MHIAKPGPEMRQNSSTSWPHGVLSGGMLIDILEHLSGTQQKMDWSLSLWLQEHYIAPFGRVERLDGLVVASKNHMALIILAHEWYIDFMGKLAKVQRLWVPGLEPTYIMNGGGSPLTVPALPRWFQQKVWRASDMYYKNGIEVKRKGCSLGEWKDEMGWHRRLWMAPGETGKFDTMKRRSYTTETNAKILVEAKLASSAKHEDKPSASQIGEVSPTKRQFPPSVEIEETPSPIGFESDDALPSPSRLVERSPSFLLEGSSRTTSPDL